VDRDGDLQPAARCAQRVGVSKQLFRYWLTKAKLTPAGTAADGRPLYSVRQAALVERATRRSPLSHRAA
jgi:Zn-dependent peptidase ImmA (M78 family)